MQPSTRRRSIGVSRSSGIETPVPLLAITRRVTRSLPLPLSLQVPSQLVILSRGSKFVAYFSVVIQNRGFLRRGSGDNCHSLMVLAHSAFSLRNWRELHRGNIENRLLIAKARNPSFSRYTCLDQSALLSSPRVAATQSFSSSTTTIMVSAKSTNVSRG
jgi:hypothetical protein